MNNCERTNCPINCTDHYINKATQILKNNVYPYQTEEQKKEDEVRLLAFKIFLQKNHIPDEINFGDNDERRK